MLKVYFLYFHHFYHNHVFDHKEFNIERVIHLFEPIIDRSKFLKPLIKLV